MFSVVIKEKGGTRKTMKFEEDIISIGRVQGNEIVLPRGNVSKRHAKLELVDNGFVLTDLGSTNGTYINGRRVHTPTPVYKEDSIYVGDYILSVTGHTAAEKGSSEKGRASGGPAKKSARVSAPRISSPPGASGARLSAPPPEPRRVPAKRGLPSSGLAKGESGKASSPPGMPELRPLEAKSAEEGLPTIKMEPLESGELSLPSDIHCEHSDTIEGDLRDFQSHPLVAGRFSVASETEPPTEPPQGHSSAQMLTLVETIVDHVARQIKRVDRTRLPALLDPGTAGRVRIVIDGYVNELNSRGKLPTSVRINELKGKVFRSVVDLGPLAVWLDDPEINMIRIVNPRTAQLRKMGEWIEASTGFAGAEDVAEAIRCLGAGLEPREGEVPGISWYRLEEGYLTFTSHFPGRDFSPGIIIDKTLGFDKNRAPKGICDEARKQIEEAIEARTKIAVVGATAPLRQWILGQIIALLPKNEFVVTIEDIPFASEFEGNSLRLSATVKSGKIGGTSGISPLVEHALAVEPSWLVMSGTTFGDIPTVLGAASVRDGVIVELPLGGPGKLDREIAISLTNSGVSMKGKDAAFLLQSAFDIILVVDRSKDGTPEVARVLASGISKLGEWSPKTLYGAIGGS